MEQLVGDVTDTLDADRRIDVRLFSFVYEKESREVRGYFQRLPVQLGTTFEDIDKMLTANLRSKGSRHIGGGMGYILASHESDGVRYPYDENVLDRMKVEVSSNRSTVYQAKYLAELYGADHVNTHGATGDAIMFSLPLEFAKLPDVAKEVMHWVLWSDPFKGITEIDRRQEKGHYFELPRWVVSKFVSFYDFDFCPLQRVAPQVVAILRARGYIRMPSIMHASGNIAKTMISGVPHLHCQDHELPKHLRSISYPKV